MNTRGRMLLAAALLAGAAARAQIGLPPLPDVTRQLPLPELDRPVELVRETARATVSSVRERARALIARHPGQVERDPRGAPVVRSVIVALSPGPGAIEQARASGFEVLSDEQLDPLGEQLVTLLAPRGVSTERALRQLRNADPRGSYDFDHLFVESAAADAVAAATGTEHPAARAAVPIGMVDGGVDASHPAFALNPPELLGCDGRMVPSVHGTAVASLLVGAAPQGFRGAAPGARLTAVDVYCGNTGPGGRVRDIAAALALLARKDVRVINLSFVGPHNVVLERVVKRVQDAGIVIVAAAGNDGPNAKPLYPAAYPGVVAVTAVDARDRLLLEACRGEHVAFAAPGADMLAAVPGGGYAVVRGTSYAAPLVAGLLAREIASGPDNEAALARVAASATDLGKRGRDRNFGEGLVARELRTAPPQLAGKPAAK